jgi:hypothetical protein
MSVFRPSARVTDPHGRACEISAFRMKLPERGSLDPLVSDDYIEPRGLVFALPFRTSYMWTATRDYRRQVLAQVEGGIARGEKPQPRNAQFVRAD